MAAVVELPKGDEQRRAKTPDQNEGLKHIPPMPTDDPEKMIEWGIRYIQSG